MSASLEASIEAKCKLLESQLSPEKQVSRFQIKTPDAPKFVLNTQGHTASPTPKTQESDQDKAAPRFKSTNQFSLTQKQKSVSFEDLRYLDDEERDQELLREEQIAFERGLSRKEKDERRK